MRKIIQVAVTGVANTAATQCNYITTALCDDGTVWEMDDASRRWGELAPIPQPPYQARAPYDCKLQNIP